MRQIDAARYPAQPLCGAVIVFRLHPRGVVKSPHVYGNFVRRGVIDQDQWGAASSTEAPPGDGRRPSKRGNGLGPFDVARWYPRENGECTSGRPPTHVAVATVHPGWSTYHIANGTAEAAAASRRMLGVLRRALEHFFVPPAAGKTRRRAPGSWADGNGNRGNLPLPLRLAVVPEQTMLLPLLARRRFPMGRSKQTRLSRA
jgi:hypothetical protein